jgi:16S rRNA (guanine527-N7)-methyltransferase
VSLATLLVQQKIVLPERVILALEELVDELLRWNARRNLTAITGRDEVLEKHLVDSLTLLPFATQAKRLIDIGSGAGFPALPLKIACPALEVVSVDAVGKKVDFQRHIARRLELRGFSACHARVEALSAEPGYAAAFDLVTARAVTRLDGLVEMAAPLLAAGGRLIAMKGAEGAQEYAALAAALERDGWGVRLHSLRLPRSAAQRCLIELVR